MRISEPGNQFVVGLPPDFVNNLKLVAARYDSEQRFLLDKIAKQWLPVMEQMLEQMRRIYPNLPSLPPLPSVTAYIPPKHLPPPCDHSTLESEIVHLRLALQQAQSYILKLQHRLIEESLDHPTEPYDWDKNSLPDGPEGPSPSF